MAYVVRSASWKQAVASASVTPEIARHSTGDLLLLCVTQDGGGTTIAATGWTSIGTQAASAGCRTAWLYKIATSDSETPEITGSNDSWIVMSMVVRGYDATTPIHAWARADTNGVQERPSPALITTINNCLLLYSWGSDSSSRLLLPLGESIMGDMPPHILNNDEAALCCRYNQLTAGATPTITAIHPSSYEGGNAWVIAIADAASGGGFGPEVVDWMSAIVRRFGNISGSAHGDLPFTAPVWSAPNSISGLTAIGGVSLYTAASVSNTITTAGYGVADVYSELATEWLVGGFTTPRESSVDVAASIMCVTILMGSEPESNWIGDLGALIVFVDSSNNWAAWRIGGLESFASTVYQTYFFDTSDTPDYSGGSINLGAVTQVGLLYHRSGEMTSTRRIYFSDLCALGVSTIVHGCSGKPAVFRDVHTNQDGWFFLAGTVGRQGARQVLIKYATQIGDGSTPTYFDSQAGSMELPIPYGEEDQFLWRIPANRANLTIYASNEDTILLRNCVIAANSDAQFTIHASSSLLATYDFSGLVLVGWSVTWKTGVDCEAAIFQRCKEIDGKAASFNNCRFIESNDTAAIAIELGADINDCAFVSSGSGHAIEITQTGTYVMDGNTFTGYGANDTTDAVIYNSSGGAVTIQISNMSTPTVRNSAGSTTTIAAPEVTLTLTGLKAGSEVRAYVGTNPATATEIDGVESSGTSFSFSHEEGGNDGYIVVHALGYESMVITLTYSSSDQSIPVSQRVDRWYSNPA